MKSALIDYTKQKMIKKQRNKKETIQFEQTKHIDYQSNKTLGIKFVMRGSRVRVPFSAQ